MSRGPIRLRIGWPFAGSLAVAVILTGGLVLFRGTVGCEHLLVASSQEKADTLGKLKNLYNGSPHWVFDLGGVCATVDVSQVDSGAAERGLESVVWPKGLGPKPDVWAPASSAWVSLLLAHAPDRAGLIPKDYLSYSLFVSPLVFAMPDTEAKALQYPSRQLTWTDLLNLADGRNAAGAPAFLLGGTNPRESTSGLHTLIGLYHALEADGSSDSVNAPSARASIMEFERSVVHYGETASQLLEQLYQADDRGEIVSYLSALPVEEQEVVEYDFGALPFEKHRPHTSLIPVYPQPATPYADHPYVILNPSKRHAALSFYDFLEQPAQRIVFDQSGFRLANGSPDRDLENRLEDLGIRSQAPPSRVVAPSSEVLDAEIKALDGIRKQLGE